MSGLGLLMCRACLVTDVKLFNLHQIGLADLFGYLSKTVVSPSDGLPQYVCFYCRTQLRKFNDFQNKCQKSLIYFKENSLRGPSGFCIPLTKTSSLVFDCVPEDIVANNQLKKDSPYDIFDNSNNTINVKIELDDPTDFNDDDRKTDEKSSSCDNYDEENYVTIEVNVKNENIDEPSKEFKKIDFYDDDRRTNEKFVSCDNIDEGFNVTLVPEVTAKSEIVDKTDITAKPLKGFKKDEDVLIDTNKVEDCRIVKSSKTKKKTDTRNKPKAEKKRNKYNEKFEEDFEEFSEIHNVRVVCLSKDEQIRRVQDRKESQEYRDSRFPCDVCYKGFLSDSAHKRHMKSHDPSSGAYVCEVCHMRYPTQRILNTHARLHKKIFVCTLCDQVNVNTARAKLHSRWHKGIKFTCKTCHKEFKAHSTYLNHVREVHKPVPCAHCGQTLLGTHALEAHMSTHEQDVQSPSGGVFSCELCGARFSSDRRLGTHYYQTHNKKRKILKDNSLPSRSEHLCEKCAKSFSVHINVHTGDRPYKCPQCPETFKSYAQRYKHKLLVHTAERRYKCSMCDKSYVIICDLKSHVKYTHLNQPRPPRRNRRRKQCGDNLAK